MKSSKNLQITIVLGVVVLTVLLYFANKKGKPVKREMPKTEEVASVDLGLHTDSIINSLDQNAQSVIKEMKQLSLENSIQTITIYMIKIL